MSLCPEAALRDAMTDDEFWHHVFCALPTVDDEDDQMMMVADLAPCDVCGERGPCGYDTEGRPWVHLIQEEDA